LIIVSDFFQKLDWDHFTLGLLIGPKNKFKGKGLIQNSFRASEPNQCIWNECNILVATMKQWKTVLKSIFICSWISSWIEVNST